MSDSHHDPRPSSAASRSSRRRFLANTAPLAGAGPLLSGYAGAVDRSPLPSARARLPLGPDDPIRMAVIGTGGMGTAHCRAFLDLAKKGKAKVQIVALCDVCEPRLEKARKICEKGQGGAKVDVYGKHEDLLARDDIHGVLIAAPEHWHAPLAEAAVAAGKDVYVEKPMTLRLPEAQRLLWVTKANPDIIVQVGTQYMTRERFLRARDLIAKGEIGKPVFSQTSYCRNSKDGEWNYYRIDPKWEPGVNLDWERWCGPLGKQAWDPKIYARWRRYRKYSTGIIGDLLVHEMTPMINALEQGWPTRVVACGGHYIDGDMENHDQVNLTVQFEGGHTMIVAGSTCNEKGLEVMVRGHHATLYLGGKDLRVTPERHWVDDIEARTIECKPLQEHTAIRLDWLNSIRTRKPNLSQVELGTKVMVIVDLATRSMWEGKAFAFDPETMQARPV